MYMYVYARVRGEISCCDIATLRDCDMVRVYVRVYVCVSVRGEASYCDVSTLADCDGIQL